MLFPKDLGSKERIEISKYQQEVKKMKPTTCMNRKNQYKLLIDYTNSIKFFYIHPLLVTRIMFLFQPKLRTESNYLIYIETK